MSMVRRAVEPVLLDWWSGGLGWPGAALSWLAAPPEALFRTAVAARAFAYERGIARVHRAPLPVVSVGNLAVGGTGKTPVTAWVARRLQDMGVRPAVVLRGYGDDEVRLHRRWNPAAFVIGRQDRLLGAQEAASQGATVVVLDDGFQHRRLARDLDLTLIAAEQPFPRRLLPAGPFREGAGALRRSDLVAVTRRTAGDSRVRDTLDWIARVAPERPRAVFRLTPDGWSDLWGVPTEAPEGGILAVAGVAHPHLFRQLVAEQSGADTELLAFPDHHAFDAGDARRIERTARGRTVVVTEKDAVKLVELAPQLPAVRVLSLAVHIEQGQDALTAALARIAEHAARVAASRGRKGREDGEGPHQPNIAASPRGNVR